MLREWHQKFFLVLIMVILLPLPSWSARVVQTKGKSVIIELDGLELNPGDRVRALIGGKAKAIIEIKQVKGNRALGLITKGATQVDAEIEPPKNKSTAQSDSSPSPRRRGAKGGVGESMILGAVAGYAMDSQTVKLSTESVAMTGSGYSLKAILDYPISTELGLIGRGGIEMFNVSGSATAARCNSSTACSTEIMYITGDLLVRYLFDVSFHPYVAGGFGIHFPLTKKSNILDESRIASTTVFLVAAGSYIEVGDGFIPVQLEYGYFPPSAEVTTTMIALRAGYGIRF